MDINTGNSVYKISDSGSPIGAAFFNRNSLFGGFDITHQKIGTLNDSPDFVPLHTLKLPQLLKVILNYSARGRF